MSIQRRKTLNRDQESNQKEEEQQISAKPQQRSNLASVLFSSERRIFLFCLAFRSINSLLIQTYFNPDEHWQALEVAHRIAFGYGHLTWEWQKGIRSYLHPLIFALLYKTLAFFNLDTPWFMTRAPRLLQSVFASIGDFYLYKLAQVVFDEHIAKWALFCQLSNWFMFYCIARTLSNSLETVLTLVGLYYWFSYKESYKKVCISSRMLALFVAALACGVRPTSAVTWVYVGVLDLIRMQGRLGFLFLEVAPIGFLVLALIFLVDWWMYGSLVFVPFNFLKFNFLSSGGDYYGTHKWHWYFTQGFTVMLFTFLPLSIIGIYKSKKWRLSGLIAWVLGIYSILGHKEFRFVLPVLPIALMFSGYSLAAMSKLDVSDTKRKKPHRLARCPSRLQLTVCFLLVTNLPMALYMSLVHQRGSEDVMYYLSREAKDGRVKSIVFLMPCHATPYYSILHRDLPMRFLDCTPSETKGTLDESDHFRTDPVNFTSVMLNSSASPSHIVIFDSEERNLRELLASHSFKEVKRFFHAHFKVDRDLQGSVVVYAQADQ